MKDLVRWAGEKIKRLTAPLHTPIGMLGAALLIFQVIRGVLDLASAVQFFENLWPTIWHSLTSPAGTFTSVMIGLLLYAWGGRSSSKVSTSGQHDETIRTGVDEKFGGLERDVKALLYLATDQTTVVLLDSLITEGKLAEIPLGSNVDPDFRDDCCEVAHRFIGHACSAFRNSHRGLSIQNIIGNSESEAEAMLRSMPASERPTHIDVLDYRRFAIVETSRKHIVAFLEREREQKLGEIRQQRNDILERMVARDH